MTCAEIEKWAGYYRYFYFYEDMTFERFIKLVEAGSIPQRQHVDWSKVGKQTESLGGIEYESVI